MEFACPTLRPASATRGQHRHRWTVYEQTGSSIACDVVNQGEWGWEIVLSRNGHWFFGQGFPTFELAKVEAENLEATCLREGCVLLRPQLGVPPVTLSGPADALD